MCSLNSLTKDFFGVLICSTVSFSILGDIPSTHGDLISFILLILLATTSGLQQTAPTFPPQVH